MPASLCLRHPPMFEPSLTSAELGFGAF